MERLNKLEPSQNKETRHQSFHEKLDAAKEKANLREFEVTITETLQKTIKVAAKDLNEAKQIVKDDWYDSEHILDSSHFTEVKFDAALVKREISGLGEER